MRIIGGQWRSRVLERPRGDQTRPMPDRVKEAVFDALGSLLGTPGALPPLIAADIFCGSGTMGLEALSRGAASCYFFERHRRALAALRANIAALDADERSRIMAVDAWKSPWATLGGRAALDVLFVDPPYRDSRNTTRSGKVWHLLADAGRSDRLADNAIAIVHHEMRVAFETDPESGWTVFESRRYGSNRITWFRREVETGPVDEDPPAVGST